MGFARKVVGGIVLEVVKGIAKILVMVVAKGVVQIIVLVHAETDAH